MYNDGFWYTYDDIPAGGTSKVLPASDKAFIMSSPGFKGKGECARLTGVVTNDFEFGFIGMGYYLSPMDLRTPFDLSAENGISFWQKGDGKLYRVKLVSTHPEFISQDSDNQFGFNFKTTPDWQKVEIPFKNFTQQPGWGSKVLLNKALYKIKEIQFMTLGQPLASVELWIDGLKVV
jgi:hypothetical protein